ncbi:MAG: T9SS type A sorting domain-containing protein [Bacteroidetes bacterium]|nr:T9SS type A sorting domain-containing protein [Bacteroidota bacterium]
MKNAAFSERPFRSASVYFILFTFVFSPFLVFSQNGENPNLDQLPGSMVNRLLAPRSITTSSSVITVNNWDNFTLGIDFAESNMTANPSTPAHYFTAYNINTAHHAENGLDWVSVIPDFGATMQGDPVVATDGIGNLFYGNMYGSSSIEGLKVIKSSDNGATWGPGVTALDGNDKCWIACDQTSGPNANNVYACMTNNGVGNFSRSIDHGNTFTSTFAPATQTIPGMMVCVGPYSNTPGGSVYVVTNSGSSFSSVYTFYRSLDGGVTFTEMSAQQFANYVGTNVNGRNSVSGMRTRPYPLIAADNSSGAHHGRLYLVYASNDPPGDGNKPDIFSRYSDNGGTTWSPAKKVNDDTGTENNSQWHPAIWCDKDNGRLYVQWMDTRDTPTHDSASIYATYSSDGGVTFAANQKISNEKMQIDCPTCGGGGTPRYQGDYNGICSNKKVSMAGWTDFRYGSFLSTTSYFPDFAMTLDHSLDTLITVLDSTTFTIAVPEVKLYSDTVLLSGTVFPDPVSGTLVISFPSGNRITAFPGSLPARVKLTGNVPVGDYQLQFFAKGPNGTPVHERNATLRVLSRDSVYVTASATPDKICAGASSQLQATTLSGTGPYSYSWTPVTGLNNPTIANPIASPTVNTWYRVHVTDAASHSASDSVLVSIVPVPNPPASINGPAFICTDSVAGYSVQPVSGASSYSWTVPAGAQILSGQNTTAIIVQWGNTGGSVSVIAGNQCGNSNPSVLAVTVSGPPLQPAGIKGPAQVCSSANVIYSVDPVPEAASYFWTVPADATILSGQNTDSISVGWGANAGDVSIAALNSCGESPSRIRSIALETVPGSPGTITGNDTVCSNHESYPYSIAVIPGATSYKWVTPQGTTITSGSGTNSIVISINPSAVSGPVSVQGSNTCGLGITGSKNITVRICTGISENNMETGISIYPNPAEDLLNIDIRGGEKQIELHLLDVRGQIVYREPMENIPAGHEYKIDVSLYSRGIYFIEMISSKQVLIKKIILQ